MSGSAAQVPDQTPPFKDAAIALLRAHADELRARGVTGVWMFGSVARGDDDEESDLDIAVSTDAEGIDASVVRLKAKRLTAELTGRAVDVARYPMQPQVARASRGEVVRVF